MSASENSTTRMKGAASALLKGGTLVGDPCGKCGGVQVRFGDKTSCINCGNETGAGIPVRQDAGQAPTHLSKLRLASLLIEEKVLVAAQELKDEKEITFQKQKSEILEGYIRILEMMRRIEPE